jgi:hypothetical protein
MAALPACRQEAQSQVRGGDRDWFCHRQSLQDPFLCLGHRMQISRSAATRYGISADSRACSRPAQGSSGSAMAN